MFAPSSRHKFGPLVAIMLALAVASPHLVPRVAAGAQGAGPFSLLITADGEGHVSPCSSCPGHPGNGGLARRVTVVSAVRAEGTPVLLADAGNWLAGAESVSSRGAVIVAAYDALGYDVANVTTKDLYWGRQATLDLLKSAKFAPVSATLVDEQTATPVFAPYAVQTAGNAKVAVLGLCEPPAGLNVLPHLRQQLAGVRIRPPAEALDEWLPKAKAEADHVVVLYHGNGRGLRALRAKLAGSGVVVAAGGVRPENVMADGDPPVVAAEMHGKSLARATFGGDKNAPAQVMVTPDLAPDEAMQQLLAKYAPPPVALADPEQSQTTKDDATASNGTTGDGKGNTTAGESEAATTVPPAPPPKTDRTIPTQPPPGPARVTARQPHEPKGLAGVGLTAEQVNDAIERGSDYLWNYVKAQRERVGVKFGANGEYDLLNGLALVKTGAHKRYPDFDAQLRAYLPKVRPAQVGVYGSAVLCLLLDAYGDPEFYPQLAAAARYLFEGQTAEGSWQYYPTIPDEALLDPRSRRPLQVWGGRPTDGSPAERWLRRVEPDKHEGGDNSVTQYAVLGLHAAARGGVEIPADTWKRVLDLYKARQDEDGAWGYINRGSAHTGSMTCAGVYAISLARFHLGQRPHAEDEAIERGLAWLAENFSVSGNPGAGGANHYYYLYSLERSARTLETEFIGPHEWYPLGAKFLLDVQKKDGSWIEPGPYESRPDLSTSFALLFLTKGTAALTQPLATGGKGVLKTAAVEPPPASVYLVFDCSGSMMAEQGGGTRFDAARESLKSILDALPPRTQVALRVYGHRKTARQEGADEDTELLVPMGPMDRADLAGRIERLRARGRTPLARSVREAARDLAGVSASNPCTVILITDGGEDTNPRQDPVAAAADLGRLEGVTMHVVGFDIGREDWGKQLRGMARAGRGRYWAATDAAALRRELKAALLRTPERFTVTDAGGKRYQGVFGRPLPLPEGKYTLSTAYGGKQFAEPLWVNTAATTAVMFDAGKVDVTEPYGDQRDRFAGIGDSADSEGAAKGPESPPAPKASGRGAADISRFCTHCGTKLAPAAKFCSGCGVKVRP
ncbi:MAG TPA: VWA domain-containing protein [Tepidisphaeraceae bacterium]|nr:VWA domain-containing protein [Tepidisphaeraceae bacterium]